MVSKLISVVWEQLKAPITREFKLFLMLIGVIVSTYTYVATDYFYVHTNPLKALTEQTIGYVVPSYFMPEYQSQWQFLEQQLVTTQAKHIILKWNGDGGYVSMGEDFIRYIKTAQAQGKTVQLLITDTAISEHAMVVCAASSYVMTKTATLHYHAEFTRYPYTGKKRYEDRYSRWTDCVDKKILSNQEVSLIVDEHKRIVVNGDGTHTLTSDWDMKNMADFVAQFIVIEVLPRVFK